MGIFGKKRSVRKHSAYRGGMIAAILEGIPAIIMFQLLGGPFVTGYLLYLGATSLQVGIVLAIPSLANMLQLVAALLIQRFTNRKLLFTVLCGAHRLLWLAAGVLPMFIPRELGVSVYIAVCIVAFMSQAMGSVFWTSLIADMVPAKVRGRYLGIRNTILWAGGCIAIMVFGQLLDRLPERQGFEIMYMVAAVCAVLDIAFFLLYPNRPFEKSQQSGTKEMLAIPFRHKPFLKSMLFISLWLFLQGISVPFYSYVMLNVMNVSYNWIAIATMTQNVAMMAGYFMWGNLNAKIGSKTLLFWTLPVIAAACMGWGLLPLFPDMGVLLLIHALIGIGTGGFNQLMFNFVIGDTPKSERPVFIAVFYALTGLAGFLGPLLGGAIYRLSVDMPVWVQLFGVSLGVGVVLLAVAALIGSKVLLDSDTLPRRRRKAAGWGRGA
ncbi:MFS transporter [Paenibacillus ginsengarvi]|uniref:MFS transporter n=1 Tax=Paenibacillus ginsengarvi TaxID=400777 RepID=UPI001F00C410|nr:MFS transporter [Paenibacillus ginsengarvi]